jgi:hypothetical protein
VWDSTSQKFQGIQAAMVANLVDTYAALANVPTSIDMSSDVPFTATGLFSASNAGNVAVLTGFEIEIL